MERCFTHHQLGEITISQELYLSQLSLSKLIIIMKSRVITTNRYYLSHKKFDYVKGNLTVSQCFMNTLQTVTFALAINKCLSQLDICCGMAFTNVRFKDLLISSCI